MGQIFTQDNIPLMTIASVSTITMATTFLGKATRITVGGQQYTPTSTMTLSTATTGFNGLDTGSIAANTLYYVYVVLSGGVPGLVMSLASPTTGPTGFTSWQNVGRVRTFLGTINLAAIANWYKGENRDVNTPIIFTPTFQAGRFVPGGTGAASLGYYIRIGEDLIFNISGNTGSTFNNGDAGILYLSIPNSFSVNIADSLFDTANGESDFGTFYVPVSGSSLELRVKYEGTNGRVGFQQVGTGTLNFVSSTITASGRFGGNFKIPIAEYRGLYT